MRNYVCSQTFTLEFDIGALTWTICHIMYCTGRRFFAIHRFTCMPVCKHVADTQFWSFVLITSIARRKNLNSLVLCSLSAIFQELTYIERVVLFFVPVDLCQITATFSFLWFKVLEFFPFTYMYIRTTYMLCNITSSCIVSRRKKRYIKHFRNNYCPSWCKKRYKQETDMNNVDNLSLINNTHSCCLLSTYRLVILLYLSIRRKMNNENSSCARLSDIFFQTV